MISQKAHITTVNDSEKPPLIITRADRTMIKTFLSVFVKLVFIKKLNTIRLKLKNTIGIKYVVMPTTQSNDSDTSGARKSMKKLSDEAESIDAIIALALFVIL